MKNEGEYYKIQLLIFFMSVSCPRHDLLKYVFTLKKMETKVILLPNTNKKLKIER